MWVTGDVDKSHCRSRRGQRAGWSRVECRWEVEEGHGTADRGMRVSGQGFSKMGDAYFWPEDNDKGLPMREK